MLRVTADNVYIVNVTAAGATRRRLQASPSAAPTTSSGILAAYLVIVASHYDQSALQSQLASATSNGFFNQQLTVFAEQFGAAGFVNATSAALVIATASPTASPISKSQSPRSNIGLSQTAILGVIVGGVAFVVACLVAVVIFFRSKDDAVGCKYMLPYFQRSRLRTLSLAQPSRSHITPNPFLLFDDTHQRRASPNDISNRNIDGLKDSNIYPRHSMELDFVNPSFSRQTTLSPNRKAGSRRALRL